jgi:hypothetical protein
VAREIVSVADAAGLTLGAVALAAADGGSAAYAGTAGLQVGTAGTVAAGLSGQLSTGWTSVRQSGADTLACSKVARADLPGHEWQRAEVSGAAGASQWDLRIAGTALATLGLAVGSRVRLAVELAFNVSSSAGPYEVSLRAVEPNAYAQANTGYTGGTQTTGPHAAQWYYTPELQVPAGTNTMDVRIRLNVASGGSLQVDIGRCVLLPA